MLERKIAIYVPSTIHTNKKASAGLIRKMIDTVTNFFCVSFGGSTAMRVTGSYKDNAGNIVTEDITYIYAYADTISNEKIASAKKICKYIAHTMDQESVSLEIDNALTFIEQ